jgi:sensor histidine kinase YesM
VWEARLEFAKLKVNLTADTIDIKLFFLSFFFFLFSFFLSFSFFVFKISLSMSSKLRIRDQRYRSDLFGHEAQNGSMCSPKGLALLPSFSVFYDSLNKTHDYISHV